MHGCLFLLKFRVNISCTAKLLDLDGSGYATLEF